MNQVINQFDDELATHEGPLKIIASKPWSRSRLFGLIFMLSLIPVLGVCLIWPVQYQTTGMVIVGNLDPFRSAPAVSTEKLGDPADLESQILIAKSPRMIRLALERPGVATAIQEECKRGDLLSFLKHRDCSKFNPGSEDLLNYVVPRYTVRAEGRSRVISVGYRSASPDVAFILANALIVTYLEDQRAENGPAREQAVRWLLTPTGKVNEGNGNGDVSKKDAFYKNLYGKATDFETERRSLPNPSRLVSFAEMPAGPNTKLPVLAIGLAIAAMLAGFVAINKNLTHKIKMPSLDVKKAFLVFGVTLFCLACVTNVDDTSSLDFLRVVHSPCLLLLYIFCAAYFFFYAGRKLELGHGVYLLFCVYTLISLLWSDHLVDVLSNAVHALGLFFVCVAICDAIENSFSRFLWTVLFNVTIISALSILIVVANPDIGIMYDSSYAGLHSEFSLNGRWCGVTSHPNELGSYAAIGLLIAAYFLLNHKPLLRHSSSTLNRLLIVAFILTNIIALNGSGSKTSLSAATFSLMGYVFIRYFMGWFQPTQLRQLPNNLTVFFGTTVALFLFVKTLDIDKIAFEALGRDPSLTGRIFLWEIGWDAIRESPLVGWSFDYFTTLKNSYGAFEYNQFHNAFIDLLARGGIIAFLIACAIYSNFMSAIGRVHFVTDAVQFSTLYLLFILITGYSEASLLRHESFAWFVMMLCWFYLVAKADWTGSKVEEYKDSGFKCISA